MTDYKKILYAKYEQFMLAETRTHQLLLRFEIKTIFENIDAPDAEDYHILGLS